MLIPSAGRVVRKPNRRTRSGPAGIARTIKVFRLKPDGWNTRMTVSATPCGVLVQRMPRRTDPKAQPGPTDRSVGRIFLVDRPLELVAALRHHPEPDFPEIEEPRNHVLAETGGGAGFLQGAIAEQGERQV